MSHTRRSALGRIANVYDRKHDQTDIIREAVVAGVNGDKLATRVRLVNGPKKGQILGLGEFDVIEFLD